MQQCYECGIPLFFVCMHGEIKLRQVLQISDPSGPALVLSFFRSLVCLRRGLILFSVRPDGQIPCVKIMTTQWPALVGQQGLCSICTDLARAILTIS